MRARRIALPLTIMPLLEYTDNPYVDCLLCGERVVKHIVSLNGLVYCPSERFRMYLRMDLYKSSIEAQHGELFYFVESCAQYDAIIRAKEGTD